jgi:light-regulated signal transduction histidine kinase (bacteriophytochrome)
MKLGVSSKGSARKTSHGRKTPRGADAELAARNAELTAALDKAHDELEALTHSISHDLRAPLRHVSGFADLLRAQLKPADAQSAHYLDALTSAAARMSEMMDRLLALSRSGREPLNRAPVDLRQLVSEVRLELAEQCAGRTIDWRIGALPAVHADRSMLRSALVDALSNAVKFTSGRIPAVVEIDCRSSSGEHELVVRDNGVGFDMRYVNRLFNVFQRLHTPAEYPGTGVGLAIVRRIIERHGGRAWIESIPGQGTTLHLALPLHGEESA